jgi:parallel beta-helix repeat protein
MNRKFALAMALMISFTSMLGVALKVQRVKASDTIYIKADGSVDPDTAPISSTDNITYTLTGNIIYDKIVVQRDDIIIDGKDFTIEGTEAYDTRGIDLNNVGNVTVKNVKVIKFYYGIYIYGWMPPHTIIENYIANNTYGVYLQLQDSNIVVENNITNNDYGIRISGSGNNNVSKNHITNNERGISLWGSDNIVHSNTISGSHWYGIEIEAGSNNNKFYHDTFINNSWGHASISTLSNNIWDDGYPSGGNYWDDFEEKYPTVEDVYSGEFQNETGSDGIWDHPYLVDAEDVDHHPLVPEFPSFLILPLFMIATILAVVIYRRKLEQPK